MTSNQLRDHANYIAHIKDFYYLNEAYENKISVAEILEYPLDKAEYDAEPVEEINISNPEDVPSEVLDALKNDPESIVQLNGVSSGKMISHNIRLYQFYVYAEDCLRMINSGAYENKCETCKHLTLKMGALFHSTCDPTEFESVCHEFVLHIFSLRK